MSILRAAGAILERRRLLAATAAAAGVLALARKLRPGDPLDGCVALVTGGTRGLGYLLARELLREGCDVVVCGRDPETLERAVHQLRFESGGAVEGWTCDVGDRPAVERLVADTLHRYGRLDIVVNNAGIIQVAPLETLREEDFRAAMDTDFWGTVHTTLAVLPHMRARGSGRIVNITSIAAHLAPPHLLAYNAAKHAKLGLSEGLHAELADAGIAVTTVVPGLMRTGSPVHVEFRGKPPREYAWFALGAVLPISAMSADRAARRIVRAIRRREARLTLTLQAKMVRLIYGLAPALTGRGLAVADRLLPSGDGRSVPDSAHGTALRGTLPSPVEWALDRAARSTNQ